MKPYRTCFENKYVIYIYGILVTSAFLTAFLAVKNIRISPDSMIYALVSEEILSGNGIRLPIIYYLQDNHNFVNGSVPYVGAPPLLPVLFAILGGITPQSFLPAQIINVISHTVISVLSFLLVNKFYNNKAVSLLTGMLVAFSYPLLWDAHHILTESLYIALTLATIYFLIHARHADSNQSIRCLIVAGMCTSAAVLTRFAGIALLPVFFWGAFLLFKNNYLKLKHISAVLTAALPFIVTGALFIVSYMISGSTHGLDTPLPDRSYLSAIAGTMKMIILQFDLGERHVTPIAILAVSCIVYIAANTHARKELSKYIHSGLDLILIFAIAHTVLISHAMARTQTVFELRYMHPLVPFLFISCILIMVTIWETIRIKGFSKLSLCGLILSLGILSAGSCYKTYLNSRVIFSRQAGHYRILNSPTYKWIKENLEEGVVITSNKPFHLSFFGGYSTIRLPHRRFNRNYRIPENMESFLPERMLHFGSHFLVLFEKVDKEHEGDYLAGLFNKRENNDNFILTQQFPDGVVYRMKE